MSVVIITDSASDIDAAERRRLRVEVIGIRVFFGEDAYLEGENMTVSQFYGMLSEADELPKTAQITPLEFEERIRPHIEAGDDVVVLPLSKELSGTYGNAVAAAAQFPEGRVQVVDTRHVTFGLALMVQEAAAMREGMPVRQNYDDETYKQRWRITGTPAGYSIVNRLYKKALTLDYSGDIVTCTDAGAANQRWELTPVMTL